MYRSLALAFLVPLFTIAYTEPVRMEKCSSTRSLVYDQNLIRHPSEDESTCEVSNVRVTPCPEAENDEPCKLRRGKTANIAFDFMPHFNDDSPMSRAYWSAAFVDLPFVGMDTDACKYATCPIVAEQQNHYNYTLDIDKKFIAQRYNVKWKVWKSSDSEKKECCFIFKMRLV